MPITYNEAKAAGTVAKYTWQANCDPETGLVKLPIAHAAPCVPAFNGTNGGATRARSDEATPSRSCYYQAKPDPQSRRSRQAVGAYDPPERGRTGQSRTTSKIYESLYELYGRKIKLVKMLQGTGDCADETAAQADADKAADEMDVFAVIGGPTPDARASPTS